MPAYIYTYIHAYIHTYTCFSLTFYSSKLEPKLTAADQFEVIQVSTDSVFSLPLIVSPMIGKKKEILVVRTSTWNIVDIDREASVPSQ